MHTSWGRTARAIRAYSRDLPRLVLRFEWDATCITQMGVRSFRFGGPGVEANGGDRAYVTRGV
eukprot:4465951-Prymnesium_polylepis.1